MTDSANDLKLDLHTAACEAWQHAYAPYSQFKVGAALRSKSGEVFAGCNVENAAYPQGWCAEASALAAMVVAGQRELTEIAIVADSLELVTPCGGCRQKLREFARPELLIHLCNLQEIRQSCTLAELLPLAFGPEHL